MTLFTFRRVKSHGWTFFDPDNDEAEKTISQNIDNLKYRCCMSEEEKDRQRKGGLDHMKKRLKN